MEQNENNKIETSHEEMQKKLKKQRIHRRSHPRLRTLEDCLPFPGL